VFIHVSLRREKDFFGAIKKDDEKVLSQSDFSLSFFIALKKSFFLPNEKHE
jgi:hypothetical protein